VKNVAELRDALEEAKIRVGKREGGMLIEALMLGK
jgi:hypothetical protein